MKKNVQHLNNKSFYFFVVISVTNRTTPTQLTINNDRKRSMGS
jgi:WD40 repeat protein